MKVITNLATLIRKHFYFKNAAVMLLVISGFVVVAAFFEQVMNYVGDLIKNYDHIAIWTIVITAGIGAAHAILKRTKEENTFFLKFINNAFLGAIFTSVTYGIVINACLTLSYIVLYDDKLMANYPHVDNVTTAMALLLLFIGSLSGLLKMVWEICKPPETTVRISPQEV